MSLSSPLVVLVSPNRGTAGDGLCSTCSSRLKPSSNPVNSSCAWKFSQTSCAWARNFAELQTIRGKANNIRRWKQVILTSLNGVKKLCPLLSTDRTTKSDQLVTCRVDRSDSRINRKQIYNKNNGIVETPWSATRKILNSIGTSHRRKPVPTTFDCGRDPKNLLRLMHFALEAVNDEILWKFLISSASSFRLRWKCARLQN